MSHSMSDEINIIIPDWQVPTHVKALTTTRRGGVSKSPFNSFNLAHHVGDDKESVQTNREILRREWLLPTEPYWLNQTHSIRVLEVTDNLTDKNADASWTEQADMVCCVMTADCLPLLMYQSSPESVAATHAGWRGLLDGIIENTIDSLPGEPHTLKVWLGPAIGPRAFEVGPEVREAFIEHDRNAESCFVDSQNAGKYMADLYQLAIFRLRTCGVKDILGGQFCTFAEDELFYSYRRDGETGRMASMIWLESE